MLEEIRLAARGLARRPGYAIIATATLGLGIGASVAIFAVVSAVLLKPLPYPDSDRIVQVGHHAPGLNLPNMQNSPGTLDFYRTAAHKITNLAAVSNPSVNLTGNGPAVRIEVARVSPEFFDVVAIKPARGRVFVAEDAAEGATPVAILMDGAWRARFGGDPSIIGRKVEVDGISTEIIGIMPPKFAYPDPGSQALLPMKLPANLPFGQFGIVGLARLAPGATIESAQAELTTLRSRFPERFPGVTADFLNRAGFTVSVTPLRDSIVRDVAPTLWVLLAGVGLLLVIATANVANLFLVRAESRGREMALRSALGAGRGRLAMTFLSESVVVGAVGGALGLVLAYAGVRVLVANGPSGLPRLHEVGLNGMTLAFAIVTTVVVSAILGMMPFAALRKRSNASSLREGGRSATAGRQRHRVRRFLIATQVAMSLVLLVGAQLMLASVRHLKDVNPGFRIDGVLTVSVSLADQTPIKTAAQFYQQVVDEASRLPGVKLAGATNSLPIDQGNLNGSSFSIQSKPQATGALPPVAYYAAVTPGYFETMGIAIKEGRAPTWQDGLGSPRVIWVNETFAKKFLDGRAIGERIRFSDTTWSEIVGVVGDERHNGLKEDIRPMAFHPVGVVANAMNIARGDFVLQTDANPATLTEAMRSIITRTNAAVPVVRARTMKEVIATSVAQTAFTMTLLTIAALVAVALGVVGLYGVISYVVGQRINEFGVRMALGARPGQVRRMVLKQGLFLALAGIIVGLVAATGLTRLMSSLLFEVSARDPIIFGASALALMLVSVVASDLPARRAAGVQPVDALRSE